MKNTLTCLRFTQAEKVDGDRIATIYYAKHKCHGSAERSRVRWNGNVDCIVGWLILRKDKYGFFEFELRSGKDENLPLPNLSEKINPKGHGCNSMGISATGFVDAKNQVRRIIDEYVANDGKVVMYDINPTN